MFLKNDIEILRKLFSKNNYIMTTAELTASKLYYPDIKLLMNEGLMERVKWGYYHWIEDFGESEIVIINRLFPDAALCMETALFYYRYSDRNLAEWNFAIDKYVSKLRTKIDYPFIKAYRVEPPLVTLGETRGKFDSIDVDFLLLAASNSIEDVKVLIEKIINTPTGHEYISMTAKEFEEISLLRKYHSISAQIIAPIKNVRVPFNVNIGVGDVIVPRDEEPKSIHNIQALKLL